MLFSSLGTALAWLLPALLFFALQLLCLRSERRFVRLFPLGLILAASALALLIALGLFGRGSGFLGDVNKLVAIALLLLAGMAALGALAALLVKRFLCKRR